MVFPEPAFLSSLVDYLKSFHWYSQTSHYCMLSNFHFRASRVAYHFTCPLPPSASRSGCLRTLSGVFSNRNYWENRWDVWLRDKSSDGEGAVSQSVLSLVAMVDAHCLRFQQQRCGFVFWKELLTSLAEGNRTENTATYRMLIHPRATTTAF